MRDLQKVNQERIQRATDLAVWAMEGNSHEAKRTFAEKALLELNRVKEDSPYLGEPGRLLDAISGYLAVLLRHEFGFDLEE